MQGTPVSLALPSVVGMPVEQVLWTINHPASQVIRFAGRGDVLDEDQSREIRMNVQTEIENLIANISPALPKGVGKRLYEFRLSRRQNGVPPLEDWVSSVPGIGSIARQFGLAFPTSSRWKKLIIQPQTTRGSITIRFANPASFKGWAAVATLVVLVLGVWGCWGLQNLLT